MKKLVATFCVFGTALALAACSTDGAGHMEDSPYAVERTAGGPDMAPDRVFTRAQRK